MMQTSPALAAQEIVHDIQCSNGGQGDMSHAVALKLND